MTAIVSSFFQTTGDATGIRVVNSTAITVNTNTINGGHMGSCSGGFWGIHVQNSGGQVDTNTVGGIGNAITTGCQEGRGIEADGARHAGHQREPLFIAADMRNDDEQGAVESDKARLRRPRR